MPSLPSNSPACDEALRDVRYGKRLVDSEPARGEESLYLRLFATHEAIAIALDACKGQAPEADLKHDRSVIRARLEEAEEKLLSPLKVPGAPRRRKSADIS